ncbi:MAG: N-acetylmuramoyl-L-alanine amidase [Planctomycetes bacterium]|nr:N-acetylmuramoyl-L-alanine amidase [Planctomycetota bacterium]
MRAFVALAAVLTLPLAGCSALSSVRMPWSGGGSACSDCAPPPRASARATPTPCEPPAAAPAPEPEAPPPPADLGPVVPPPPPESVGVRPGPALPPMPSGPRAPWSPATDPDLSSLPEGVAVAQARPWSVVVVHHSATARGSQAIFDRMHRERGWEGVGYDFVIGNGTDTGDGEIEVTFRWREQRDGAHAKGWNDVAIGICLVGNFETTDPTPAQRSALVTLLRHLRRRFGIPAERIVGHGTLMPTKCPGARFVLAEYVRASAP